MPAPPRAALALATAAAAPARRAAAPLARLLRPVAAPADTGGRGPFCGGRRWLAAGGAGEGGGRGGLGEEAARLEDLWRLHRRGDGQGIPEDDTWLAQLTEDAQALVSRGRPEESQMAARDALMRRLETASAEALRGCSVTLFGSAITGLWTAHSDLDVCLVVPGAEDRHRQIRLLRKLAPVLKRTSAAHHVIMRGGAQVPILRWAPRRSSNLACDISINNVLAVANSRLLRQYVQADERLRQLALCVKTWARRRGINDRSRGTLSSFALTLMLVHFLQRRQPPVLPSLQDLAAARGYPPVFIKGADCRYCSSRTEIGEELERLRGGGPENRESLGLLLREFFRYFGYEYTHGTIAIRDRKCFAPAEDEDTCYLRVDNPFEPGTDIANVEVSLYTRLREEFRRAHALLSESCGLEEACAPPPSLFGLSPLADPLQPGVNAPLGAGLLP